MRVTPPRGMVQRYTVRPISAALRIEELEARVVPSASASVTGLHSVLFTAGTGDVADTVYLTGTNGNLSWGTALAGPYTPLAGFTFAVGSTITANINGDGTLYLETIDHAAGTFTSSGTLRVDATVASGTDTSGTFESLTLNAPTITVTSSAQILGDSGSSSLTHGDITLAASISKTANSAQGRRKSR